MKLTFIEPDLRRLTKECFVADMHFHTHHSHDCRTPVKGIIAAARKKGIMVAFTDHNRIGGVLEAKKYKDAPVIPSIEICSKEGKEVIPYFYDAGQLEEFYNKRLAPLLKEKNALRSSSTPVKMEDLLAWLRDEDCVVHLPHPFAPQPRRSYPFFTRQGRAEQLAMVDSVEIFNGQMTRKGNLAALGWAVSLEKGAAGGSDGHDLRRLGNGVTVTKATSVEEHLKAVLKGKVAVYGQELKRHERVVNYAQTSVRTKIEKGFKGGIEKGLSFPRRAFKRL